VTPSEAPACGDVDPGRYIIGGVVVVVINQKNTKRPHYAQSRSRALSLYLPLFRFHPAVVLEIDLPAGVHKYALAGQLSTQAPRGRNWKAIRQADNRKEPILERTRI